MIAPSWLGFRKPPLCSFPDPCLPITSGRDWVERADVGELGLGPEALGAWEGPAGEWQVRFPCRDQGAEEKLTAEDTALPAQAPGNLEEGGMTFPSGAKGSSRNPGIPGRGSPSCGGRCWLILRPWTPYPYTHTCEAALCEVYPSPVLSLRTQGPHMGRQ